MRKLLIGSLILACSTINSPSLAQENLVEELMVLSGLSKQIESLPEVIIAGVEQSVQGYAADTAYLEDMYSRVRNAYNVAEMRVRISQSLGENLSDEDIQATFAWLKSDLGRKITQLEEEHSTLESEMKRMEYIRNFSIDSIDPKRLKLMKRLDDALMGTEATIDIIINSQKAIMMATMQSGPPEQRMTYKEMNTKIEMNRPALKKQMKDIITASLLFGYQDLTTEEINQYIEFAQSEAGVKYHKAAMNAVNFALTEAGRIFGHLLANVVHSQ